MRTLVFGAGPLGSFYSHLLNQAGKDVTLLTRGQRYDWIKTNGLVLLNQLTGAREKSSVRVVNELRPDDEYDLAVVLIRKNKLLPVFQVLAANACIGNVLFMGNNAPLRRSGTIVIVTFTDHGMKLWEKIKMGVRFLTTWGRPPAHTHSLSPDDLAKMMEDGGFAVEISKVIGTRTKALFAIGKKDSVNA